MGNRISVISIMFEDNLVAKEVNDILSNYSKNIIARLGLPYKEQNVNIICVVIDSTEDNINSLSGKLGKIAGVSVKANYINKK